MSIQDHLLKIKHSLEYYLNKYNFEFIESDYDEILIKNHHISVSISYHFGEFSLCVNNSQMNKTLNEFIFQKYPDYINLIKKNPDNDIFKKGEKEFTDFGEYLAYLIQTSFKFIEINFPKAFEGKLM